MTRSTVALTGATGFIGTYLLGELALRGYQVRVLLRSPTAAQNHQHGDARAYAG